MLKRPITSSPSSNYAATALKMLVNKTVSEVILKLFSYFSAGRYERLLTISGMEGALQEQGRGKKNSREESLDI